jgi:hypothetical protein
MNINQLLHDQSTQMLYDAFEALSRAQVKSYEAAGSEHLHSRLKALFTLTARGVKERNLLPMISYADTIARERFSAGYDLWEVQTAFNVLEEAIWKRIIKDIAPSEQAEALGLVSTVLGAGKDTLARTYVSLASKSKAPSLNMQSLFTGLEG